MGNWVVVETLPESVEAEWETILRRAEHAPKEVETPLWRGWDEGVDLRGNSIVYWRFVDNLGIVGVETKVIAKWVEEEKKEVETEEGDEGREATAPEA